MAVISGKPWNSVLLPLLTRAPSSTRLEPQSVAGNPGPGLAAPVHDPLWLLTRQWQFGEFAGEDAGTPLWAQVEASATPMHSWQPGDWSSDPQQPRALDDTPLDVLVEREPLGDNRFRLRAEAGSALLVALREAGLNDAADSVRTNAPLIPGESPAGAQWTAVRRVLAGSAVDADTVRDALQGAEPGVPGWLDGPRRDDILAVTQPWLQWYRNELAPRQTPSSWVGRRLEHRFRVGFGDTLLRAPEACGTPDWWSFDIDSEPPSGAAQPDVDITHRVVATPLRFPGMPADRFWEFEDTSVDLGAVESHPHDLARLLVAECALVFGCDWLSVPIDVPVGSVVAVRQILYRNTFNETFRVAATPAPPDAAATPQDPWRMYVVTRSEKAWEQRGSTSDEPPAVVNGLVVPHVTTARIEGTPVEDVLFLRDEAANLAWAVERVITDTGGDPWARRTERHEDSSPADPAPGAELEYLLQTSVPQWWIPFVPRISSGPEGESPVELTLVCGAMLRFGTDLPPSGEPVLPSGRLLNEGGMTAIDDAELPRDGVRVQRIPVLARRSDGSYDLWTARRVTVGRGEGRSGLEFDSANPRLPSPTTMQSEAVSDEEK